MSAPTQKILVVFGATGNQGGSVINSILGDPRTAKEFKIRGITRDPSKPNAKALINRGVECVEVSIKLLFLFSLSLHRPSSYGSTKSALLYSED